MTNNYFSSRKDKNSEHPFQKLIALNMNAFQNFSYLNPAEYFNFARPEQLMEKNMEIIIQNGHKALDYVEQVFQLAESNWTHVSQQMSSTAQEVSNDMQARAQQGYQNQNTQVNADRTSDFSDSAGKRASSHNDSKDYQHFETTSDQNSSKKRNASNTIKAAKTKLNAAKTRSEKPKAKSAASSASTKETNRVNKKADSNKSVGKNSDSNQKLFTASKGSDDNSVKSNH